MRGAIRKRFSANAPLLVAVNCAFRAFCFRNPPELLRSVSSSQKVLRYFLGTLLFSRVFRSVRLLRRVPVSAARSAAACIYTGTRRKPTRYSLSTKRYSTVHKSIYRFNALFSSLQSAMKKGKPSIKSLPFQWDIKLNGISEFAVQRIVSLSYACFAMVYRASADTEFRAHFCLPHSVHIAIQDGKFQSR